MTESLTEPLTADEVHTLAGYNRERARGIMHSSEWQVRMSELQARFNVIGYTTDDGEVHLR